MRGKLKWYLSEYVFIGGFLEPVRRGRKERISG
jgi:hypothetical protein